VRCGRLHARRCSSLSGRCRGCDWLPPEIEKDAKNFVRTGAALAQSPHWTLRRGSRFLLETSHPGVFAAGDVRADSVKRVASAVGEGAMAVMFVPRVPEGHVNERIQAMAKPVAKLPVNTSRFRDCLSLI